MSLPRRVRHEWRCVADAAGIGTSTAQVKATRFGNGLVTGTLQPLLELVGAAAAIHQMGVAVDQTGGHQGALQIVLWYALFGQRPG